MSIPVISYFSCFSYLGPILLGIFRFKRLNRPMKLFLFLCVVFFIDYIIQLAFSIFSVNNWEISNYEMFGETIVLAIVFITAVNHAVVRTVYIALLIIYMISWCMIGALFHSPDKLDTLAMTLGMLLIICFCITYLYQDFKLNTGPLSGNPMFWVTVGSLLYNIGVIIMVGLANELTAMGYTYFLMAWYINFTLIIVANVLYMKGFLCRTP
jgi:hypothetical protein